MRIILYILLIIACLSCERENGGECLQSSGELTEVKIELPDFSILELYDLFDVYLIDDTVNELSILTGSKLQDDIELKTEGSKFMVYNNARCRWFRDYERVVLTFRCKDLKRVSLWYPCYVASQDTLTWPSLNIYSYAKVFEGDIKVNNDNFRFGVNFSCAGSCSISGKTGKLTIMNRGVHHIFADNLESVSADITNNSLGDIHAGCTDTLRAHIWESGNIYYRGNPEIILRDITSTGRLIRTNQ